MAIYTYKCKTCDLTFEKDFPIGKYEIELLCPECKGISRKLISKQVNMMRYTIPGFHAHDFVGHRPNHIDIG